MNKQRYILLTVLIIILGGGLSAWEYAQSFQQLNIKIDQGLQVKIYRHDTDKDTFDNPIKTLANSSSIKLKKGGYAVVFEGSGEYAKLTNVVTLGDTATSVTIHPDYSDSKKASVLQAEEPTIESVISSTYPEVMRNYQIKNGTLYQRGEWYGAKLVYTGNALTNTDTYRIILKNNNGLWTIATNPPAISLYAGEFPNIPKSVLSNVNNVL